MKTKEFFRPYIEDILNYAEGEGLDLSSDSIDMKFTYPDMPHIEVYIRVGGMFALAESDNEEEIQ